ncbi:MAG TPA: glucose-6-phosphate isomerase, partial [Candidatus Omnitrophota bacterium]|nr:glucose-6-phosphate isomerase [Candidatus Omnitrophota bacterium]
NALVKRIWEKDATVWKKGPEAQKEIVARLGWLDAPKLMKKKVAELTKFSDEIKAAGFSHVLLLGMGGSSLAPELFANAFGSAEGSPELLVLDSTDPGRVSDLEKKIDLAKTLFIVSSKSGGTIELMSFYKYFYEKVKAVQGEKAGQQFVAVTDPGTPLEELAKKTGFRKVFLAPEDVGGRFSALTYFGLLPAALIGADVEKILASAQAAAASISPETAISENTAAVLGVGMAVLAEEGRDKLTIVTSPGLESFGDWAEQLVAESSGKEDVGILPVVREKLDAPSVYGNDRFFVAVLSDDADNKTVLTKLQAFQKAGHPVLTLKMKDAYDLGAQFLIWEFATSVACALLKVNTFDQPDVQAAKEKAKEILKVVQSGGQLPQGESKATVESFGEDVEPGDYIGILAFLPDRENIRKTLEELQIEIRKKTKRAVTLGIGPRYLHSTGQLHKGGPNNGDFILITAKPSEDVPVPGEKYTFGQLVLAQALGDLEALEMRGRNCLYISLPGTSDADLASLKETVQRAVASIS